MSALGIPSPSYPPLFFVTPPDLRGDQVSRIAGQALLGGITHIILRRPGASARDLYRLGLAVASLVRDAGATLVIADRLDVALALDGTGVQLGHASMPPEAARPLFGGRPMGVSVHSLDEARAASAAGADWLLAGNIYDTATHPERPGKGPGLIRDLVAATGTPVIAIGGIAPASVPEVIAAGAAGVAVIRAISDAPDPTRAARALRDALDNAVGVRSCPLP